MLRVFVGFLRPTLRPTVGNTVGNTQAIPQAVPLVLPLAYLPHFQFFTLWNFTMRRHQPQDQSQSTPQARPIPRKHSETRRRGMQHTTQADGSRSHAGLSTSHADRSAFNADLSLSHADLSPSTVHPLPSSSADNERVRHQRERVECAAVPRRARVKGS